MSPADRHAALNGRATDAQFAQNPIPALEAMGRALARIHLSPLRMQSGRTAGEVDSALRRLDDDALPLPRPFERVARETLRTALRQPPTTSSERVTTHGAPVVASVRLVDGVAVFEDTDAAGIDPPERDLAIALRSIAERFSSEATIAFLDAYEDEGGRRPDAALLDWYVIVAAFR